MEFRSFYGLLALLLLFGACAATLNTGLVQPAASDFTRNNTFTASDKVQVTCQATNYFMEASSQGLYLYKRSTGLIQSIAVANVIGGAMDPTANIAAVILSNLVGVRVYKNIQSGFSTSNDVVIGTGFSVTAVEWLSDKIVLGLSDGSIGVITKDSSSNYLASGYKSAVLHTASVKSISTNSTHIVSASAN